MRDGQEKVLLPSVLLSFDTGLIPAKADRSGNLAATWAFGPIGNQLCPCLLWIHYKELSVSSIVLQMT